MPLAFAFGGLYVHMHNQLHGVHNIEAIRIQRKQTTLEFTTEFKCQHSYLLS